MLPTVSYSKVFAPFKLHFRTLVPRIQKRGFTFLGEEVNAQNVGNKGGTKTGLGVLGQDDADAVSLNPIAEGKIREYELQDESKRKVKLERDYVVGELPRNPIGTNTVLKEAVKEEADRNKRLHNKQVERDPDAFQPEGDAGFLDGASKASKVEVKA